MPHVARARALCGVLVAAVLAGLIAAAIASAGRVPAPGIWTYDNGDRVTATAGHAIFRAFLRVTPAGSSIFSLDGIVIGGKCRKHGRTSPAGAIGYSAVNTKKIAVHADGSFSATRKAVGDATGVKGTVKVKGVFNGTRVSGKVTAHLRNPNFGDCRGSGRFSRAKGERVG